jgi:hypothetical protein
MTIKALTTEAKANTQMTYKQQDELSRMIAWEEGELNNEETVELFQGLVNSGLAWKLQGCYGRQAAALIDAGLVHKGQ